MEKHNAVIKPSYDDRLTNEDLAPLKKQAWGTYNFYWINTFPPANLMSEAQK